MVEAVENSFMYNSRILDFIIIIIIIIIIIWKGGGYRVEKCI